MSDIKVTEEQFKSLRDLSDELYRCLEGIVREDNGEEISTVEKICKEGLGRLLNEITRANGTRSYRDFRKGGNRVSKAGLNEFILTAFLFYNPSPKKRREYTVNIESNPGDGMCGLRAYIDAEDPPINGLDDPKGQVYALFAHRTEKIRGEGSFECLLNAATYIRGD